MTSWKRPELTKQVLNSLRRCKGIENYKIHASVEPGCPEIVSTFYRYAPCDVDVRVNEDVVGISENTKRAMQRGLSESEFVIHLEDDTLLMPSALQFYEYCDRTWKDDFDVGSVCGYSADTSESKPEDLVLQRWFGCCAWATWRSRWPSIQTMWGSHKRGFGRFVGGWHLQHKKLQVYPKQSICVNIGYGDANSTNGKGSTAPKQIVYDGVDEPGYQLVLREQVVDIDFKQTGLTPSECVLAADWVNVSKTGGDWKLYGSYEKSPWQLITPPSKEALVAVWADGEFINTTGLTHVIVIHPKEFQQTFLSRSGFKNKWRSSDGNGVDLWVLPSA